MMIGHKSRFAEASEGNRRTDPLRLTLLEGRLFVSGGLVSSQDWNLRIGDRIFPLQRVAAGDEPVMPKKFSFVPSTLPPHGQKMGNFAVQLNALDDWRLKSTNTLQIEVSAPEQPRQLSVGEPVPIPPSGTPYEFHCLLATHGAEAALELVVTDDRGNQPQVTTVPFEKGRTGGRTRSNYQEVRVQIPASRARRTATLRLLFRKRIQ